MKTPEIKTNIDVDGAALSQECIEQLKAFQENRNDLIDSNQKIISDAVCLLAIHIDMEKPREAEKIQTLLTELVYLKDYLDNLRKL